MVRASSVEVSNRAERGGLAPVHVAPNRTFRGVGEATPGVG